MIIRLIGSIRVNFTSRSTRNYTIFRENDDNSEILIQINYQKLYLWGFLFSGSNKIKIPISINFPDFLVN